MAPKTYTTTQAARAIGVTRATIQAWVAKGIVEPPQIQTRAGKSPVRLWAASDIARLRAAKKQMEGRIGRPKKG
jgi:DNA-binding transcriptional MerR regulator